MNKLFWLFLFLCIAACKNEDKPGDQTNPDTPPAPASISYSVVASFPHDTSSYTQGLVFYKGELYEGTGLEKRSKLMNVDLKTGKALRKMDLDSTYFGEGITIINDTLYQLTWQNKVVFMYSLKDFKKLKEFMIPTEGWGITTDGKELIVSDGTSNLNYYEPGSFRPLRTVSITEGGSLVNNVNELEFINGYIYANKYQSDYILKIDPVTGIVVGKADLSNLADQLRARYPGIDVLNGIAYDAASNKIYITGKWWPELYEIRFGQ
ncbi:MAG TPA: glutaminyl-peptide cyclotransferase [Chitinophagaceae bacterium]|nr:glutaminyl-peptide cyclotransferase [Chitinophagaceae bacterium]